MDRYQRVEKPKPQSPIRENEIRITTQGVIRNYVSYATSLLIEKRMKEIVLKAMGLAISKTVAITEILKKRIPNLHQDTAISSISITDIWEPIEEGLVPVEQTRHVSMISITVSTSGLNTNSPGALMGYCANSGSYSRQGCLEIVHVTYQAPSAVEKPKRQNLYYRQQQLPRLARAPYNVANEDSYGRGRGRGRGRGQNWGRGGYGNYWGNYEGNYPGNYEGNHQGNYEGNYQDNGGHTNWSQGGGRGRGWGTRGAGYERGRGGRGYGRGRGRIGGHSRGGGYQAY